MLCDSNILIYAAEPGDMLCLPFVQRPEAIIASVIRVEVLGFPRFDALPQERKDMLKAIVSSCVEVSLDEEIILRAIDLRRQKKMSLADSIIAATALEYDVPLVTRNEADFKHVAGLVLINPFSATP
jgi:predicted nucleic acid-binding protein